MTRHVPMVGLLTILGFTLLGGLVLETYFVPLTIGFLLVVLTLAFFFWKYMRPATQPRGAGGY